MKRKLKSLFTGGLCALLGVFVTLNASANGNATVSFSLEKGLGLANANNNPMDLGTITENTTIGAAKLPTAVESVAADTVVYGTIRTAEEGNPIAEAIAIKDGKYVYVGSEAGVAAFVKDGVTKVIDHRGKGMVMPGCTDGHSHYATTFAMGSMKGGVLFDLNDNKTNVLEKLKAAADAARGAGKRSLCGFGWNFLALVRNPPTLEELDKATKEVSTVILDQGGHHAFCNSECLKRCGIIDGEGNVLIKKIDGGVLQLDGKGYPTGYVEERVTGYLMRMGGVDYDELVDDSVAEVAIRKTRELLLSTGYTTALDGWSNYLHTNKFYEAAKRLDESGKLNLVFPMTYEVEPWQKDEVIASEIARLAKIKETYGTSHVLPSYLKIFMDGVVETKTGAMLKPYVDDKKMYASFWTTNRLADITRACNAKDLTVHAHTMGDAAVRDTVSAYIQGGDGAHRNCLVHLRNVSTNMFNDFERMAQNNIACTAGFTWHAASVGQDNFLSDFLDGEYVYHAYPMKSFFDVGIKVSNHSDFPANEPCPQDPFGIMQVAVTGMVPDPLKGEKPFDTNELITVEQAFQALTLNGAWQVGLENERGSIAVGKWADFVLADQDVFTCEKTDIGKTKVVSTWFEGEMVYPMVPGSKKTPWNIGDCVEAYTNGTELVIQGSGTITNLAEVAKDGLTAITITDATVTGVASDAFQGIDNIALTLPDGWQGELPDEEGNWYGATGATLTAYPLVVKNVKFQQRYPWNGKVDIGFGVTGPEGETNVVIMVKDGETAVANFTVAVTIPEGGVFATNLVWDAAAAGLAANFKSDAVTIEVAFVDGSAEPVAVQLWENGPYFATCNVGATKPEEYGYYFWWGDTVGYTHDGEEWVSVKDGMTSITFDDSAPANTLYDKDASALAAYVDANGNLKSDYDAATAHLGAPWRMMTKAELDSLVANCEVEWTDNWNNTGIKGKIVKGKNDYSANSIFLPAAGQGSEDALSYVGSGGFFWSSTPVLGDSDKALCLRSYVSNFQANDRNRYYGYSVRAVRDVPPVSAPIAAKSAAGALDLTDGDRVAKDVETLVVDPAWDETDPSFAVVWIDGEDEPRRYAVATNDAWETAALEPGRYELEIQTSCSSYPASFWKLGSDWVVFDGSNITADVIFEVGKTYLFFGTNAVTDGVALTVEDGAKLYYDEKAPAGFLGSEVGELPKRYEQKTVAGDLYQIVEKIKGSEDNPWGVGEGVTAYTNGTELVIVGEGMIADLSEISDDPVFYPQSIKVAQPTVTGVEEGAFVDFSDFTLTLPDGWQGELPDEDGNWYGATGVTLTANPTAVKNVKFQQRYPWNGKVDVGCDLSGAGKMTLGVSVLTNGVKFIEAKTLEGETVIDLDAAGGATNGVKFIWNAAADLPAGFKAGGVKVKVTAEK